MKRQSAQLVADYGAVEDIKSSKRQLSSSSEGRSLEVGGRNTHLTSVSGDTAIWSIAFRPCCRCLGRSKTTSRAPIKARVA